MTQQRRDDSSTEFGIWLRKQSEIDSSLGFSTTNIDYLWLNYKNKKWMLIEEKRHGRLPSFYQVEMYMLIDQVKLIDSNYKGFHVLTFENTTPDDGGIYLDGKFVSTNDLLEFLQFKKEDGWYLSWFPKRNVVGIKFHHEE